VTVRDIPDHCAKFSSPIRDAIAGILEREDPDRRWTILDPFAGVGLIHELANGRLTVASELEWEWAAAGRPRALAADALRLPFADGTFDAIITSPCYGNRMADLYDGLGVCRKCKGHPTDLFDSPPCARCGGVGHDTSTRYTYRLSLGRALTAGSSAGMKWGPEYRRFHKLAWAEATRVLRPHVAEDPALGGWLILNISDHLRKVGGRQRRQHVSAFHHNHLASLGYDIADLVDVKTDRNRNGANHDARVAHEHVIAYHAPLAAA